MEKEIRDSSTIQRQNEQSALKFLDPSQIHMIDEALAIVGDFGEVRLVIEKGRLRFVVTQRSFDAQKWQPGGLTRGPKWSGMSW
jgi:hypothetical protein